LLLARASARFVILLARASARFDANQSGVPMPMSRVFVPQEALETWLSSGRVHMVGETLFVDGQAFGLEGAVRFVSEVAGGGDEQKLLGRVKSMAQVESLGGELCAASVVLGDNAYEVIEGFLAGVEPGAAPARNHDQLVKLFAQR
jgi:hypothetical protein